MYLMDRKVKGPNNVIGSAKNANNILRNIERSIELTLWNVYILVHLDYCIEFCTPPFKKDIDKLNT